MRCDDKSADAGRAAIGGDGPSSHRIGSAAQHRIGVHLQAMYQRVLNQPVPDRFVDLIAQLEMEPGLSAEGLASAAASSPPRNDDEPTRRADVSAIDS